MLLKKYEILSITFFMHASTLWKNFRHNGGVTLNPSEPYCCDVVEGVSSVLFEQQGIYFVVYMYIEMLQLNIFFVAYVYICFKDVFCCILRGLFIFEFKEYINQVSGVYFTAVYFVCYSSEH